MKKVLITGGAGFIGSNFVHYLFNKYPDYKIQVLDALTYAGSVDNLPVSPSEKNERFEFIYGDVANADLVFNLVSDADIIVHFAAETHVTRSIYDNKTFFQTDVMGTHAVTNAVCKFKNKIDRFIHISTSEVYGTAVGNSMAEDHPLNPMSPYAAAKCGADRLVYSYMMTYQIPAIIVRPFNNYGARQHLEKVVPRFITSALKNEEIRVHGDGQSSRDFVYVDDHCDALDLIMHAPIHKVAGEIFNVGSDEKRDIYSIAKAVVEKMNADENLITYVGNRPGQVHCHISDSSKIKDTLGWIAKTNWDDGLSQTIDWYINNQKWWEKQLWLREIPIETSCGKKELH